MKWTTLVPANWMKKGGEGVAQRSYEESTSKVQRRESSDQGGTFPILFSIFGY